MVLISTTRHCEKCCRATTFSRPNPKRGQRLEDLPFLCRRCGLEHQPEMRATRSELAEKVLSTSGHVNKRWDTPRPVDCAGGTLARNPDEAARIIEASGGFVHPCDDSGLPKSLPVAPMDPTRYHGDAKITKSFKKALDPSRAKG